MFNRSMMSATSRGYVWAGLFFAFLVAAQHLPLLLNLDTHVIGRSFDDSFEVLWQLTSIEQAIFEEGSNPLYRPEVYYPRGWFTASGAQPPWYLLLLSPFTALLGPVITYNLAILASFVFAGMGVYWLVVMSTGKRGAGFLAGCAYIAAPVFTLRLGGHFHILMGMMFLPYATASMLKVMAPRSPVSWRWLFVSSAFLAAVIISQWYFLFVATLPLIGLALLSPSEASRRDRLIRFCGVGIITLMLVAPFALLTWQARREMFPDGGTFSSANTEQLGFSPDYLLSPNPLHPLWRDRITTIFPITGEQDVVSIGYATALAAVIGLFATPWRKTRPFIAMGFISLLLGLGLTLQWRGERVLVSVPKWVESAVSPLMGGLSSPAGKVPVALPGLLLYHWLPFYSSLRVWARFDIPLMLAVAVLAGFGAARLLEKGRGGALIATGIGVVIVFEGLVVPYSNFTPVAVNIRTVDAWLAVQPEGTSLIEYPRPFVDKEAMYAQSNHGQSVVNGYMSFQPAHLTAVDAELGIWPNAASLPILREWGVDLVLISGMPDDQVFRVETWPELLALDGLCLIETFPGGFGEERFRETHVFAVLQEGEQCPSGTE